MKSLLDFGNIKTCLVLALCLYAASGHNAAAAEPRKPRVREAIFDVPKLTADIEPLKYDITLTFLEKFASVEGEVDILLKFPKRSFSGFFNRVTPRYFESRDNIQHGLKDIILHLGQELEITDIKLATVNARSVTCGTGRDLPIDEVLVHFAAPIIDIRMKKTLPSDSFGCLSIKYKTKEGKVPKLHTGEIYNPKFQRNDQYHTVRFEPGHAHELIPCFDESNIKTVINLVVNQPNLEGRVISNMPETTLEEGESNFIEHKQTGLRLRQHRFEQFVIRDKMPIHSLAIAIGDFEEEHYEDDARVRVFVPAGHLGEGQAVLKFANRMMNWMKLVLRLRKHLSLVHLVAVPGNANWNVTDGLRIGMINHEYFLVDKKLSSPERKVETAFSVALVLAKQFFGNTQLARSRDDLWITDGLAMLGALKAMHELQPRYKINHYTRSHIRRKAFEIELATKNLIVGSSRLKDELSPSFALVRMVRGLEIFDLLRRDVVVDETIFSQIIYYLAHSDFGGGISRDNVARAFNVQGFSTKQVEAIVKKRVMSCGDPSIVLQDLPGLVEVRHQFWQDLVLPVGFKMEFLSGDGSRKESFDVPVTQHETQVKVLEIKKPKWFRDTNDSSDYYKVKLVDKRSIPYYRVVHNEPNLGKLYRAMARGQLSQLDRMNLISDELDLWLENHFIAKDDKDTERLISSIEQYKEEKDSEVLLEVTLAMQTYVEKEPHGRFKKALLEPLKHFYRNFGGFSGSSDESTSKQRLKSAINLLLVELRDQQVHNDALAAFDLTAGEPLAYLRDSIFLAVGQAGSAEQRQKLADKLKTAGLGEERSRLARALEAEAL